MGKKLHFGILLETTVPDREKNLLGGEDPVQIWLAPGKSYMVRYTLDVCAALPVVGSILPRQSPYGVFADAMSLRFSVDGGRQTLHHAAVLLPREKSWLPRGTVPGVGHSQKGRECWGPFTEGD